MVERMLDLFAGCGGLSLGFESIKDKNGKCVFEIFRAADIDKYACETLRKRYGEERVIEGDITKSAVRKRIIDECKGNVSIILGGIPCQSFSLIGPRSGYGIHDDKFKNDKRDYLYLEFKKIVKAIEPKILVIENVKGIISKKGVNGRRIIDNIISDFESLGYTFNSTKNHETKFFVLNAADYGVPQKRERIIIIGIKKSWKDIGIPCIAPTHSKKPDSDLHQHVTLFEAIGDLPKVEPRITSTGLSSTEMKRTEKHNKKVNRGSEREVIDKSSFSNHLKNISESGREFFDFVRSNGYEYIDNHICRSHQLSDIKLFSMMNEGETSKDFIKRSPKLARKLIKYDMRSFRDKYRKQKYNDTSTTLFAHLEKDGNRFIHPKQARTFTPREAARIQSFPDDFVFAGTMSKQFRQIGNAVPPLLAKSIAKSIFQILGGWEK